MRVMLATDGSVDARIATQWLMLFPLPAATEILVLAAVAPTAPMLDVPVPPPVTDAARADARDAADAALATLGKRWSDASTRIVDGEPRQAITDAATDWGASLIVLGARGLGTFRRMLLGSVSAAVVHHASCPVLVVRGRVRELRTAVVAIDGSSHSRAAARFLAALPLDPASTVRLVGVLDPQAPRPGSPGISDEIRAAIEELAGRQRVALDETLRETAQDFEAKTRVERAIRVGPPAGEILKAAERADLVVVGARGLGPVDRLLVGSVSDRVLRHSRCPVLVVKPAGAANG